MKVALALMAILCIVNSIVSQEVGAYMQKEKEIEQKINELMSRMTLEEKIGQMTLYTSDYDVTGPVLRRDYIRYIKSGQVGALFNAFTVPFTRKLQQIAVEETRLHIPLLFGYDVIHGFKTIFPIPLGEAASWDLEAIEKSARISAKEASAAGLHWTFAPMVDIARDPRWGRVAEGSGEDPYLGALIAQARVRGFQGENLDSDDTILACAKHFVAYGAAEAGRDYNTVDMSERLLREIYLPPFKAALDAGVATFMSAFNELDGQPCTGNERLLTQILRNEWGFKGFVVSDYTSINEMVLHGVAATDAEAGKLAIMAGLDMDMQGAVFQNHLPKMVREGVVPERMIDEAVRRILRLKCKLGLFEDPYRYCNEEREKERTMTPEHQAAALEVAKRSIVLLKNREKCLPLSKNVKKLAVIGPLADNRKELIGSWSAAGDYQQCVTLLEGIKSKVSPETTVTYLKGCDINTGLRDEFARALEVAKEADVVIAALGEEALMSGEAASRSCPNLPCLQEEFLQALHKTGKPIILVLMNGRPLLLDWADDNIPGILECWFLGTQAGNAIAEVIFGDYNPSGKLPISFPRSVGQIPIYYNHKNTGRPMSPEKYTSKYLDIQNTPLYPFGHGLSYTTFSYENLRLSEPKIKRDEKIHVQVDIKNTGEVAGTEIVQLYVRDLVASVTRPVKELKGFQKITLLPGETKTVQFVLKPDHLAFYDRQMKHVVEPGSFEVMVGTSSRETLKKAFEVIE